MDADEILKTEKFYNIWKHIKYVFLKTCMYIGVIVVCMMPVAGVYYMNKIEIILENISYSDGMRLHKEMDYASEEKRKQEAEEQLKKDARGSPRTR